MSAAIAYQDDAPDAWTKTRPAASGAYVLKRSQPATAWNFVQRNPQPSGWKVLERQVARARISPKALSKQKEIAEAVELRRLTDTWRRETMFKSSAQEIVLHPSYQQIIGFGERAVPFILDELRASGGEWFWALRMITRDDPVRDEDRGNYDAMKDAWLAWADQKGL